MIMEHLRNNIDKRKPKYLEVYMSQGHTFHHTSHTTRLGMDPVLPLWQAGDSPQILSEKQTLSEKIHSLKGKYRHFQWYKNL